MAEMGTGYGMQLGNGGLRLMGEARDNPQYGSLKTALKIVLSRDIEELEPLVLEAGVNCPACVRLQGNGKIVNLRMPGTLLTVGTGLTLILEKITLRGHDKNSSSLVKVAGGHLILGQGSLITDNRTALMGGGVWVESGRLTLAWGAITRNAAHSVGGGLYLQDGVVIMRAGKITENVAGGMGGGMYVNSGIFIRSGGVIADNISKDSIRVDIGRGGHNIFP
jgi:hypothetical protein